MLQLYFYYKSSIQLQGVFIDTFYDSMSVKERTKFDENVNHLWNFSINVKPFECKDIKIALTELMEAKVSWVIPCFEFIRTENLSYGLIYAYKIWVSKVELTNLQMKLTEAEDALDGMEDLQKKLKEAEDALEGMLSGYINRNKTYESYT